MFESREDVLLECAHYLCAAIPTANKLQSLPLFQCIGKRALRGLFSGDTGQFFVMAFDLLGNLDLFFQFGRSVLLNWINTRFNQ